MRFLEDHWQGAIPIVLGLAAFWLVFDGFNIVIPTNIAWLGVSNDPKTYYLGWLFFRNADWGIPPGLNPDYGMELGSAIFHTDSVPLFAFVFKLLRAFLPHPFQYHGMLLLLNFVLQSVFAWQLMGSFERRTPFRSSGVILFLFSPIFVQRLGGHYPLTAHWLILAALWNVLRPGNDRKMLSWHAILAIATGFNAYLLVMVSALWIADVIARLVHRKSAASYLIREVLLGFAIVLFELWMFGFFALGGGLSGGGFGLYRMSLLALVDSDGNSQFLADLPSGPGDYEGHNYLGLGNLFLLGVLLALTLRRGRAPRLAEFARFVIARRLSVLLALCLALTLFALSNNIGAGGWSLTIPLPNAALGMANVLRASGRLFWPVFYLIVAALLFGASRHMGKKFGSIVVFFAAILQLVDLYPGWTRISARIGTDSVGSEWDIGLRSEFWVRAAQCYGKIRLHPVENMRRDFDAVAYLAGNNRKPTDAIYHSRVDLRKMGRLNNRIGRDIVDGRLDDDTMYIVGDAFALAALLSRAKDVRVVEVEGFNAIMPRWRSCFGDDVESHALAASVLMGRVRDDVVGEALGEAANVRTYLWDGWQSAESGLIWTGAKTARLVVQLDGPPSEEMRLKLRLGAMITREQPTREMRLRVDDIEVGVVTLSSRNYGSWLVFDLPMERLEVREKKLLLVTLIADGVVSPKEVGMNNDERELGVALMGIELEGADRANERGVSRSSS